MEEMYWRQFWETGRVTDYLVYKEYKKDSLEREETGESDYSNRDGAAGITYR